ncbi:MAG: hypothetical protein QOD36_4688, partial [Mycobacterium sp.]|nr:hypothetical protein [Mycobacterium sp.]
MSTTQHLNVNAPKSIATVAISAAALASAALVLEGAANAAPAGPALVENTVSQLQGDGYQVIVNKV